MTGSNDQLQQQLEYTLLKPDCHSCWILSFWVAKEIQGRQGVYEGWWEVWEEWSFKGVQGEISSKRPTHFKSGQLHFHQDSAPVHNSILVTDYLTKWASRQFLRLPIIQTLLTVTFCYSLISQAVVMRQLRWKRLWRTSMTRSHKRSSMGPSRSYWNGTRSALQPEESTSKGLECPYEKSLETYLMIFVNIYIYII